MGPTWSGTISFGLVSVPVRMFTATESKELRFHFLHKRDLQPLGYDRVREDTAERVDPVSARTRTRSSSRRCTTPTRSGGPRAPT